MKIVEKRGCALERVLIYGAPKVGKTRLATSLPWGPYWGERAIIATADNPSSDRLMPEDAAASHLKSVLDPDRLIPIVPDGEPNWMEEAVAIARGDYSQYKDVRTLIWDTMTETSRKILRHYSDTGVFSNKHNVQVGDKQTGSWHTGPMEGDFGAVHNTIAFLQEHIWSQPLHLIIIFHEDWIEPKEGSVGGLIGGPATVGRKAIRWLPARYDSVFYMQRRQKTPDKSAVIVNTQQRGIWVAGVRTHKSLPPSIELEENPTHFWDLLTPKAAGESVGEAH